MKPENHWGIEIRDRRRAALVTQRELAARVGISQGMISRIEVSGDPVAPETSARLDNVLKALERSLETRRARIRERALAKLSAVELRALGLDGGEERAP